jgi:hypothetical protein
MAVAQPAGAGLGVESIDVIVVIPVDGAAGRVMREGEGSP